MFRFWRKGKDKDQPKDEAETLSPAPEDTGPAVAPEGDAAEPLEVLMAEPLEALQAGEAAEHLPVEAEAEALPDYARDAGTVEAAQDIASFGAEEIALAEDAVLPQPVLPEPERETAPEPLAGAGPILLAEAADDLSPPPPSATDATAPAPVEPEPLPPEGAPLAGAGPILLAEPEPEPEPTPEPEPEAAPAPRLGWFQRLRLGLSRSTGRLTDGIAGIFTKRKLGEDELEQLEELLITADLGPHTAARLTESLRKNRIGKEVTAEEVRALLAAEAEAILQPVAKAWAPDPQRRPHVVLVCGVNGVGKTTTIGKVARQLRDEGRSVMLAAGDTFRAAAVEQLRIWGERTGAPVIHRPAGADAAGLVFDAVAEAQAAGTEVLLVDTAGRLQNKSGLMDELAKIVRVMRKQDPTAPHDVWLILDATTGQNAHAQVEVFKEMVAVTGLIVTKLDGSAKGGVLVSLADRFALPVHFIGVGETAQDLQPFRADEFAHSLLGL